MLWKLQGSFLCLFRIDLRVSVQLLFQIFIFIFLLTISASLWQHLTPSPGSIVPSAFAPVHYGDSQDLLHTKTKCIQWCTQCGVFASNRERQAAIQSEQV